tara:strand:- start:361 stop:1542 length:1182 start_codon:yes stop_codon:yes gene_type:complete
MPKKIVLAYSGGLDTSVILKWLQTKYSCPVVTFTADIGQGEELDFVKNKAESLGVKEIFIEDLKEEFVSDYVFPMFRANALYEGVYFLGTAIARPLIAKRQIEIANEVDADAVAHGATGKGNDQIRFELGYYSNNSKIKVISPWREWNLNSRIDLLEFAEKHQIAVLKDKQGEAPFSTDANLLHTSSEGKILEDPWIEAPDFLYSRTKSLNNAKNDPEELIIGFEKGDPISINNKKLSPANLLLNLNDIGKNHGVGREDIVENRFIGIKSRGIYETPGGTILAKARRAIESITLDKGEAHLKDEIMPKYSETIYNGLWFSSERNAMQNLIDSTQKNVTGDVRLRVFKGNVIITGRRSSFSKYDQSLVSFDQVGDFDQKDAEGFIKIQSLRLKK